MSVTNLQSAMILKIAHSEFTTVNGQPPENKHEASTWASDVIVSAQDKGVFTSLLNAGLVYHDGVGFDAVCGLTDSGFDVYKNINQ